MFATATSIGRFPEIGRVVPEVGDVAVRERFVHSYRVIYRDHEAQSLDCESRHAGRRLGRRICRGLVGTAYRLRVGYYGRSLVGCDPGGNTC
jgi:hypothetical protein